MKYSKYQVSFTFFNKDIKPFDIYLDESFNIYMNDQSILSDKYSESFESIDLDIFDEMIDIKNFKMIRNSIIYV